MRLQTRINAGIVAIGLMLVVPLALSLRSLHQFQSQTAELRDREYAATLLTGRMRSVHDELGQETELLGLFPSDTTLGLLEGRLSVLALQADSIDRLVRAPGMPRVRSDVARLREQAPRAYALARSRRTLAADSLLDIVMRPALADIDHMLSNTELALQERTSERVQLFADEAEDARVAAVAAFLIAALLAILIALFLGRSISAPMRELNAGMRAVAEGRYSQPIAIATSRSDEFGRLAQSYRSMARQLQELDRLKAEFVSVASHELKTPVNVVLGYIQLLEEGVYGDLTPKQREILTTLGSQTQLLSRLVRQLLDVGRFDAGGGRLDVRPIVLDDFLTDLDRAFRVLAMQREVTFDVRRERDVPHEVSWDSVRINEVLGNLLSNAFKFTTRGGRVTVHVRRDGELVRILVRDTGTGIPPDQLPHIFEKFYQGDENTPNGLGGMGLGLAIAKSIVNAHGGTIRVESRIGAGTAFTILLPVRVVRRVAATTLGIEDAEGAGERDRIGPTADPESGAAA